MFLVSQQNRLLKTQVLFDTFQDSKQTYYFPCLVLLSIYFSLHYSLAFIIHYLLPAHHLLFTTLATVQLPTCLSYNIQCTLCMFIQSTLQSCLWKKMSMAKHHSVAIICRTSHQWTNGRICILLQISVINWHKNASLLEI